MPSARDLMQKADALMRSNRNLGGADHDVPVLTDIVIAGDATVLRQHEPQPVLRSGRQHPPVEANESIGIADEVAKLEVQREAEKRELAESVYYEVLRTLDVDGHDGMRERLTSQLMPVFEQMGHDLVIRAEQALADSIRQHVAAAIERKLGVPPPSDT